jgi:hypothetical protein
MGKIASGGLAAWHGASAILPRGHTEQRFDRVCAAGAVPAI